jgi:hypothetical protein
MVILDSNFTTNNTTSISTTYNNSAIENFTIEEIDALEVANTYLQNIETQLFIYSDSLYQILDLYFIKRYFASSDPSYNIYPLYQSGYTDISENTKMKEIFNYKTYSIKDFIDEVYIETSNASNENYDIFSEILAKLNFLVKRQSTEYIAVNISPKSKEYFDSSTPEQLPFYDFIINEVEYLINRSSILQSTLKITINDDSIIGTERLYNILNLLQLIPNMVANNYALNEQIDELNIKLNTILINNVTSTTSIMLRFEAETNIDHIYAIYVQVFGTPSNGVFDAAKISLLRKSTVDEIYELIEST